jgi:inosine-uridine nucleoside N-ribohydrolase
MVRKKVSLLSMMAGNFAGTNIPAEPEYNIKIDTAAAQSVVANWPSRIVFSGFEVGMAIPFRADRMKQEFGYVSHHPLAEAYLAHSPTESSRPSWDLTSVLYAVRPRCRYFGISPFGRVSVDNNGVTVFKANEGDNHQFLVVRPDGQHDVCQVLRNLTRRPPNCSN